MVARGALPALERPLSSKCVVQQVTHVFAIQIYAGYRI